MRAVGVAIGGGRNLIVEDGGWGADGNSGLPSREFDS